MSWRDYWSGDEVFDEEERMIRTVIQVGDAGQSRRTVEFEERQILVKELVEPPVVWTLAPDPTVPGSGEPAPVAPPDLVVTLAAGVSYTITEPAVIRKLWKTKPPKKEQA